MSACPNVISQEWQDLVSKIGTYEAMREFIKNDEQIPDASNYTNTFKGVNTTLKVVQALSNPKITIFFKGQYLKGNKEKFYQEVAQLAGKEQTNLLKEWNNQHNPQSLQEMQMGLLSELSYTVEINTAKEREEWNLNKRVLQNEEYDNEGRVIPAGTEVYDNGNVYERNGKYYTQDDEGEEHEVINPNIVNIKEESNTSHYSNLTVPGGTNYTENEIATPGIIPSIKGHAQFATDNGIGWGRWDEKIQYDTQDIDNIINTLRLSGQLIIEC